MLRYFNPIILIGYILLSSSCNTQDFTPPTPIKIIHVNPPGSSPDIQEDSIITIEFSHIPRHVSAETNFSTQKGTDICWGIFPPLECFDLEPKDMNSKMTITWEGHKAQLTFMEGEPIWPGPISIEIKFSAYVKHENSQHSLTPEQRDHLISRYYRFKVNTPTAEIISTSDESLIKIDKKTYVREGEPFKLIWTFDKPPPAAQLLKDDFAWCEPANSTFWNIRCKKMDSTPIYNCERDGNLFICSFTEGISRIPKDEIPDPLKICNPPSLCDERLKYDRFSFSLVWGGNSEDSWQSVGWWRRKSQIHLLLE